MTLGLHVQHSWLDQSPPIFWVSPICLLDKQIQNSNHVKWRSPGIYCRPTKRWNPKCLFSIAKEIRRFEIWNVHQFSFQFEVWYHDKWKLILPTFVEASVGSQNSNTCFKLKLTPPWYKHKQTILCYRKKTWIEKHTKMKISVVSKVVHRWRWDAISTQRNDLLKLTLIFK